MKRPTWSEVLSAPGHWLGFDEGWLTRFEAFDFCLRPSPIEARMFALFCLLAESE